MLICCKSGYKTESNDLAFCTGVEYAALPRHSEADCVIIAEICEYDRVLLNWVKQTEVLTAVFEAKAAVYFCKRYIRKALFCHTFAIPCCRHYNVLWNTRWQQRQVNKCSSTVLHDDLPHSFSCSKGTMVLILQKTFFTTIMELSAYGCLHIDYCSAVALLGLYYVL